MRERLEHMLEAALTPATRKVIQQLLVRESTLCGGTQTGCQEFSLSPDGHGAPKTPHAGSPCMPLPKYCQALDSRNSISPTTQASPISTRSTICGDSSLARTTSIWGSKPQPTLSQPRICRAEQRRLVANLSPCTHFPTFLPSTGFLWQFSLPAGRVMPGFQNIASGAPGG